ncbi:Casein kinase II subunit beta-2 [Colletotrichum fructicola]|nr:Casein kinase II subunit beta-2 [Colletotrichum fructicola]KAE9566940.1 Casein kinase II subunit beta-2 [Colletotrichum fructicola]
MYWPIGTPRIFATSSRSGPAFNLVVSHDGLPSPFDSRSRSDSSPSSNLNTRSTPQYDEVELATPLTPMTPAIQSVDDDAHDPNNWHSSPRLSNNIPLKDPVLALRISRGGQLFAVITSTSITIWQAKPTVILAVVVRSETSLSTYGENVDLLLRPDSAILVVRTTLGYLITYSLATDSEAQVYKPYFPSYANVQRRRQNHHGGPGSTAPDQILWGPGEGQGVRDVSVRFRMVIKVDAGIESALALDDELVVATRKPAAIQCIRWTPDHSGSQTKTEIISRMGWLEKKITILEMTHDRPMNLSTWITSDGKVYAVQRLNSKELSEPDSQETDPKKLFKGYCFHTPHGPAEYAKRAVVNARFSLIAVGCADGGIRVYSARDYAGNIPPSHAHTLPVSSTVCGSLTTLSYSPDGYCLFAGFESGWATWSVYGKPGSHSFGTHEAVVESNGEDWIAGVGDAVWLGSGTDLLITNRRHEAIWVLEMARSAVVSCYNAANLLRTVLQTNTNVMIYRGYDLPDLASISAEPHLWHTTKVPPSYLLQQWPIRHTVISPDGRYVAVAGRRGLAHYSVNSGRWKTFVNEAMENEFQVRGSMCWYQHILVAAIEANKSHELRLYSRETALDSSLVLHTQQLPAPVVLVASSGEDSLLVYTYENLLYHFIFAPSGGGSIRLVQLGQIAFHGIVRSPARPSLNHDGHLKYDMKVIAQNVEFHVSMRDQPHFDTTVMRSEELASAGSDLSLRNSLWVFDGQEFKLWPDVQEVLRAASSEASRELPKTISVPLDFYPLSTLLGKGIVLGVEADLVQRRDISFSFFRFTIRTHLFLPDILRFLLTENHAVDAVKLSEQYQNLEYFAHALEVLLHKVLDDEVDSGPTPEEAILPRVLSLLSSFKQYLDIVVQCTRKTEVRQWRTLFAYLPPVQELFEESLQRGSLKTAGGYLIILHTLDDLGSASEQTVRLLSRAMKEGDWELCKELARFLAAMDETGDSLREAMEGVNITIRNDQNSSGMMTRLGVPVPGNRAMNGLGLKYAEQSDDIESEGQSMGTWNTPQRTGVNQRPTKDLCSRPTISTSTPITEPTASPQIDTATSHCNISAWPCSESLSRTKRTFFSMMDDFGSESDSDYTSYWRDWFISSRGNEYFCEIDEDYLTDRFNLTGLNTEVQYYQYALDLITDVFDLDCDDEMRETIEKSARHLYGLVHARFIVTTRGLAKMLEKYKKADFGKCPRVMCHSHPLLPMGLSDVPNLKPVKLYCARCEDIYNPKSSRHAAIDGAYFGTSFHNIIFQAYPALIPTKSVERYVPRVYGFKVHASAALIRWQHQKKDEMRRRLRKMEVDSGFRDDDVLDDDDDVEFEGVDNRADGAFPARALLT